MRIAVAADERVGVADAVVEELRRRGHDVLTHGALNDDERDDWAWASEAAARDVVDGRAEQAIVCCWTGTGASIAANKVSGARAALSAARRLRLLPPTPRVLPPGGPPWGAGRPATAGPPRAPAPEPCQPRA